MLYHGRKEAIQELLTDCIQGLISKMRESEVPAMKEGLGRLLDQYQKLFLGLYPDEEARLNELCVEITIPSLD